MTRALACLPALAFILSGCGDSTPLDERALAGKAAATQCLTVVKGIDLQDATVLELRAALDQGRLKSEDLVGVYLDRIAAFDTAGPKLNSIRALAPDALEQARAADARPGPLQGIPVLLKDNIGTTDMPTTAGSIALELNVPKAEATVTRKLREAGAIVMGKTNLSEFANWVDLDMPNGYSSLGGQVIAPYDFAADPLGSSTGSGVAGTMAFATLAIGTETSGSIISPATVHSLAAVKPTVGLVSRFGIIPLAPSFDTAGPMTRSVTDAAVLLGVIAGVDPQDPATQKFAGAVPDYTARLSTTALQGARLGVLEGTDPAAGLLPKALEVLKAQGAEIVLIEEPLPTATNVGLLELGAIPNEFKTFLNAYLAELSGDATPVESLTDIILFNQEHPDKVKYGQRLLIASDATTGVEQDPAAVAAKEGAVRGSQLWIDTVMDDNDLDAIIAADFSTVNLAAAAGYPNVTVPMGYVGPEPHGLSFVGRAFSEEVLLALAYDYEQATRLRRPPTDKNPALRAFCPN